MPDTLNDYLLSSAYPVVVFVLSEVLVSLVLILKIIIDNSQVGSSPLISLFYVFALSIILTCRCSFPLRRGTKLHFIIVPCHSISTV
jgi:hypothetical protein